MMREKKIQMVDLHGQYLRFKEEIDTSMQSVMEQCAFINGPQVGEFAGRLAEYLSIPHVLPCGNGTDALQIALMGLELQPGDEIIVPAFTYAAAAEVVALLQLVPVPVDVDPQTFQINPRLIEPALSPRTKAIIAVHLFGQCCEMEPIRDIAAANDLFLIEDNAQSIGAIYTFRDGTIRKGGSIGHIGTTSFFPSKPLACYGDGGALMTSDAELAGRLRKITNHGQEKKYRHQLIGCNSRLDTLQAAILMVKLKHIDAFTAARQKVACRYDEAFRDHEQIIPPYRNPDSTHVFHQYTIRVSEKNRDALQAYLHEKGIPSMIYYPLSLQEQGAFKKIMRIPQPLHEATRLSRSVLSLPIHTEMTDEEQAYIIENLLQYEYR